MNTLMGMGIIGWLLALVGVLLPAILILIRFSLGAGIIITLSGGLINPVVGARSGFFLARVAAVESYAKYDHSNNYRISNSFIHIDPPGDNRLFTFQQYTQYTLIRKYNRKAC